MSRSATCCNDLSSSTNPGNKMVKGSFERAVDTNWEKILVVLVSGRHSPFIQEIAGYCNLKQFCSKVYY